MVLSGYPSALYEQRLYAGWHRTTLHASTRRGSRGDPNRSEVLWTNRPAAANQTADTRAAA